MYPEESFSPLLFYPHDKNNIKVYYAKHEICVGEKQAWQTDGLDSPAQTQIKMKGNGSHLDSCTQSQSKHSLLPMRQPLSSSWDANNCFSRQAYEFFIGVGPLVRRNRDLVYVCPFLLIPICVEMIHKSMVVVQEKFNGKKIY